MLNYWNCQTGLETSEALLEAMKEEKDSSEEDVPALKRSFFLEPLLASFRFTQQEDAVSGLQKWDIARRVFTSGKLVVQEGIKWLAAWCHIHAWMVDYYTSFSSERGRRTRLPATTLNSANVMSLGEVARRLDAGDDGKKVSDPRKRCGNCLYHLSG